MTYSAAAPKSADRTRITSPRIRPAGCRFAAAGPPSDPAVPAGDLDRGVAVDSAELCRGRRQVVAYRPRRQMGAGGDLLDRRSPGGKFQHVGLARRERAVSGADRL